MDLVSFVQFTWNRNFMARWICGGLLTYVPVLNFFSFGYLSKASRLLMLGSIGLPTWENRYEIWGEGLRLIFVFVLYEAIPFFLFSCGFFLTTLNSVTAFFGHILMYFSYVGLLICSYFLPFSFATYSERMDLRRAMEFEDVWNGIKEVVFPYTMGYIVTLAALYLCKLVMRIPYLIGFLFSSVLTFYVFLLATYYFTQLYRTTSLSLEKIPEDSIVTGNR